ncbi:MAG TPA: hypothetical protein VGF92_18295 [Stellaceae bacterium]|jgi:hypothetical protein
MTQARSIAKHLQVAQQCAGVGNLAAADLLCRLVLERAPRQPQAFNVLGIVAAQLGDAERARGYFEKAVALGLEAARGNLATLGAMTNPPAGASSGEQRFLLIKPWGQGFWSEVTHVLGGLLLAEMTNRIPVVHWSAKNLYGGTAEEDGFRRFFEPVSAMGIADLLARPAADRFPTKWTAENLRLDFATVLPAAGFTGSGAAGLNLLARRETLIVADYHLSVAELAPWIPASHPLCGAETLAVLRYLIDKYLTPVRAVTEECDAFHARNLAGGPSAAIHLRGSDKPLEDPTIVRQNSECLHRLAELPAATKIFGMTDDRRYVDYLKANYDDRLVMTDCERTAENLAVHFRAGADGKRRGFEIMRDTYIALRTDRFIGSGVTNVAAMIALLRPWPDHCCTIVGDFYPTALDLRLCLHLPIDIVGYLAAD